MTSLRPTPALALTASLALTSLAPSGCASTASTDPLVPAHVAVIEARIDATNAQDWDAWEALHDPSACRTAPELDGELCTAPAMRAAIESLVVAFPDYHLELVDAFGQGDWLAVRMHTTGTMTGPMTLADGTAIPPTGRSIEQDWTALVQFRDGKIVRFDEFYDQYTLLVQLGLAAPLGS